MNDWKIRIIVITQKLTPDLLFCFMSDAEHMACASNPPHCPAQYWFMQAHAAAKSHHLHLVIYEFDAWVVPHSHSHSLVLFPLTHTS
jgi:hypothetical protein